jgi:hypothetical protein
LILVKGRLFAADWPRCGQNSLDSWRGYFVVRGQPRSLNAKQGTADECR